MTFPPANRRKAATSPPDAKKPPPTKPQSRKTQTRAPFIRSTKGQKYHEPIETPDTIANAKHINELFANLPPQHPTANFPRGEWKRLHPKHRRRLLEGYQKISVLSTIPTSRNDTRIILYANYTPAATNAVPAAYDHTAHDPTTMQQPAAR